MLRLCHEGQDAFIYTYQNVSNQIQSDGQFHFVILTGKLSRQIITEEFDRMGSDTIMVQTLSNTTERLQVRFKAGAVWLRENRVLHHCTDRDSGIINYSSLLLLRNVTV